MSPSTAEHLGSFKQRVHALKNLPPIMKMSWRAGPGLVTGNIVLRLSSALIPVAMLWVGKMIIDRIWVAGHAQNAFPGMWYLLALEFILAMSGNFIWRTIDYLDVRLTDQFTREISLRIMEQASRLDLQSFEDPVFYDKLERARVQATDRTAMLKLLGQFLQQAVTFATLAVAVVAYSAAPPAHGGCNRTIVPRRESFCISGVRLST